VETVGAVSEDVVYLVDPRGSRISAVHAPSGANRWTYDPPIGEQVKSMVVIGSTIYFGTDKIRAVGVGDSQSRWVSGQWAYIGFAGGSDLLVAATPFSVDGLHPDSGRKLWSCPIDVAYQPHRVAGLVVVSDKFDTMHAVRADNGKRAWQLSKLGRSEDRWLQTRGEALYYSADAEVIAIRAATGERLWSRPLGRPDKEMQPVERSVIVLSGDTLYVCGTDQILYALDPVDGRVRWSYATSIPTASRPVAAAGMVFISTWDGSVQALTPPAGG
jgi:outer membrane protein assembly factor BamB